MASVISSGEIAREDRQFQGRFRHLFEPLADRARLGHANKYLEGVKPGDQKV